MCFSYFFFSKLVIHNKNFLYLCQWINLSSTCEICFVTLQNLFQWLGLMPKKSKRNFFKDSCLNESLVKQQWRKFFFFKVAEKKENVHIKMIMEINKYITLLYLKYEKKEAA